MSIFKRIGAILRSNKEVPETKPGRPFEDASVGDIVEVDLEEHVISGKVIYFDRGYAPHRYAYYLQNGKNISCLFVEVGRNYDCFYSQFLEGALDDPNDVPTRLVLDEDQAFELEHHRKDTTRVEGRTDFRSNDEVLFWRYIGDENSRFFLQWQDGKFVAATGERVSPAEVKFMKAVKTP
ncbi:DUF4178 domain-containing protein [Paenibacillus sp. y28]|uniref:DUF4178 domain-containing protein n=1 Tax=Paenibacillus sp. y28 TaxID=3129110 RepID=UPI0030180D54